ncbi:MAG: hypothetical protein D6738_14650 [Acidobacteria bacterium]|nr:MAG: hypothetical protein D6738_14650 [Acidobacteriota bacterium]
MSAPREVPLVDRRLAEAAESIARRVRKACNGPIAASQLHLAAAMAVPARLDALENLARHQIGKGQRSRGRNDLHLWRAVAGIVSGTHEDVGPLRDEFKADWDAIAARLVRFVCTEIAWQQACDTGSRDTHRRGGAGTGRRGRR